MEFLPIKNRDVLIYTSAIVRNSNANLGLSQFIITFDETVQLGKYTHRNLDLSLNDRRPITTPPQRKF